MRDDIRIDPLGDRAILVHLGESDGDETFRRVQAARARLASRPPAGTLDIVAGITTVAVHFDPDRVERGDALPSAAVAEAVARLLAGLDDVAIAPGPVFEVPVCYEGEMAPDLDEVARHSGLRAHDVVAMHSAAEYVVRMIGFLPGFPYLAGLDPRLATPRRATPRTRVPAGSVGIGGSQTGIYPIASPGGWQLIGRTSLEMFSPSRRQPALLAVGDRVRFRPVSAGELAEARNE